MKVHFEWLDFEGVERARDFETDSFDSFILGLLNEDVKKVRFFDVYNNDVLLWGWNSFRSGEEGSVEFEVIRMIEHADEVKAILQRQYKNWKWEIAQRSKQLEFNFQKRDNLEFGVWALGL